MSDVKVRLEKALEPFLSKIEVDPNNPDSVKRAAEIRAHVTSMIDDYIVPLEAEIAKATTEELQKQIQRKALENVAKLGPLLATKFNLSDAEQEAYKTVGKSFLNKLWEILPTSVDAAHIKEQGQKAIAYAASLAEANKLKEQADALLKYGPVPAIGDLAARAGHGIMGAFNTGADWSGGPGDTFMGTVKGMGNWLVGGARNIFGKAATGLTDLLGNGDGRKAAAILLGITGGVIGIVAAPKIAELLPTNNIPIVSTILKYGAMLGGGALALFSVYKISKSYLVAGAGTGAHANPPDERMALQGTGGSGPMVTAPAPGV